MPTIDQYLMSIINPIITRPDSAKIEQSTDDRGVLLVLHLHGDDMGAVIGKAGETSKAIRTLLHAAGLRYRARVSLKIAEPAGALTQRLVIAP